MPLDWAQVMARVVGPDCAKSLVAEPAMMTDARSGLIGPNLSAASYPGGIRALDRPGQFLDSLGRQNGKQIEAAAFIRFRKDAVQNGYPCCRRMNPRLG